MPQNESILMLKMLLDRGEQGIFPMLGTIQCHCNSKINERALAKNQACHSTVTYLFLFNKFIAFGNNTACVDTSLDTLTRRCYSPLYALCDLT